MRPVDVLGVHVEAASGDPVLLLREQEVPHRVIPLYVGEVEAVAIALALESVSPLRPLTHDLLASLVDELDAHLDRIEVTEVREGAFIAELAMSGPKGRHRVDSRPSDAIALALRLDAPLFVSEAVLDEAGAVLGPVDGDDIDDDIDEEVDRFRAFLARLDPSDFATDPDDPPDPSAP